MDVPCIKGEQGAAYIGTESLGSQVPHQCGVVEQPLVGQPWG